MIGNARRAAFVKKMGKNRGGPMRANASRRRGGKRLAAYRAARTRGMNENRAARSAVRNVPFTQNERRRGAKFKGVKQRYRRNLSDEAPATVRSGGGAATVRGGYDAPASASSTAVTVRTPKKRKAAASKKKRRGGKKKATRKTTTKARRAAPKRARGGGARKPPKSGRRAGKGGRRGGKKKGARKGKRRAAKWPKQTRVRKSTVKSTRRRVERIAYGPYKRARVTDPVTGRKRLSYLRRTKRGLKRIPEWAVGGARSRADYKGPKYDKRRARIQKRRASAAARIQKRGGVFVPNRARSSAARLRSGRRLAAFNRLRSAGNSKRVAALGAVRAVPFTKAEVAAGKTFRGISNRGASSVAKKKKKRKSTKGRRKTTTKSKRSGKRKSSRRGRKKSGSKKARRSSKKARRSSKASRRKGTRKSAPRRGRRARKAVRLRHGQSVRVLAKNRRRRKMRRNGRRYRRNGFASDLKMVLKAGAIVLTGFIIHRVLTNLGGRAIGPTLASNMTLARWEKPITSTAIGLLGVGGLSVLGKKMKAETRTAMQAGIVVSWLQSVVIGVLNAVNQPDAASMLAGYQNSTSYRLRGLGRARPKKGFRGFGAMERNARSIMPQYAPVSGTGEYFTGNAGVGEYFAEPGVQGVGSYEPAGTLALLPSRSHMGQLPIDDGIRPDSDIDQVMTLAESAAGLGAPYRQAAAGMGQYRQAAAGFGQYRQAAAGLGRRGGRRGMRGMGEYYSAQSGNEFQVPTDDQWIPNNPLWAGTMNAGDSTSESEIPAGILQGPGGNGSLSG